VIISSQAVQALREAFEGLGQLAEQLVDALLDAAGIDLTTLVPSCEVVQ
jgi:hypothetical protein